MKATTQVIRKVYGPHDAEALTVKHDEEDTNYVFMCTETEEERADWGVLDIALHKELALELGRALIAAAEERE